MVFLLNEDGNSELKNRVFPIPKGVRKHLQSTLDNYNGDKTVEGYKRLNNLLSVDKIKYNEMKRLKNYFDNYKGSTENTEFYLNGGEPMKNWVNNTLGTATKAIEDYKQTMKDAGEKNMFIKPHEKDRRVKPNEKPTQAKTNTDDLGKSIANNDVMRYESIIRESDDWHVYYDYLTEFDERYVFGEFLNNGKGKQVWTPLINPSMYAKALEEFTRFGKFEKFPTKYVYQWMGIIMRNTAILRANSAITGHDMYFPCEEFEEFVTSLCGDKLVEYVDEDDFTVMGDDGDEVHYDNPFDFIWKCGMFDWMVLPDGSDAFSDFGLQPIERIINEYNEDLPPEQVIVLVNKALDVYHQRGDLSSAFIVGGSKTLSQISNGYDSVKENKRRKRGIIITEEQSRMLRELLGNYLYKE